MASARGSIPCKSSSTPSLSPKPPAAGESKTTKAAPTPTASLFSRKTNRGCRSLQGLGSVKGGHRRSYSGWLKSYLMEHSPEAPIENLEGDALSAPTFPARLRDIVLRNEAGRCPTRIRGRGDRPSKRCLMEGGARAPIKKLGKRCSVGAHLSRTRAASPGRMGGGGPLATRLCVGAEYSANKKSPVPCFQSTGHNSGNDLLSHNL